MSVDLRTELNDGDAVTGWTGDGSSPAVNTTTGERYEGTGSIESQHTNADEQMNTTSIGGTRNLADATCYMLLKDNLLDTFANGGVQYVLGDGTDLIGYDMGGNDAVGLILSPFYNAYKLDVSVVVATPGTFNAYAGSEAALAHGSITAVGVGTLHLAKAVGNVANIKIDRLTFHANGSYALRINGGTVGTPETMADVQGDDVTNGWGLINNPLGAQYGFFGPVEWGEPAANADAYFQADNEQWFLIGDNSGGHAMDPLHFIFRVVGNATDTVSHVLSNVVIVSTGGRATFDYSDVNIDTLDLTAVTYTALGPITFQAARTGLALDACIFNDCDQVYLDTIAATDLIFNGTTDANGAILLDTTLQTANQTGFRFVSDGTGHAIEIIQAGTYNLDGWLFSGYSTASPGTNLTPSSGSTDAMIFNNSGGAVTINITGGGTNPTVRNAASSTTTVNNNISVTLTGMKDNTEVRVCTAGDPDDELAGIENATAGTTDDRSFTFSLSATTVVDITIFNVDWILPPNNRIDGFTIPASDTSIPISQVTDRNFNNP